MARQQHPRQTGLPAIPLRDAHHDGFGEGGRQNTSDAVMAQRGRGKESRDDFPTPPWATRALCEFVIQDATFGSCLEPAAGRGYMSEPLKEYFLTVDSADIFDYGYPDLTIGDFLASDHPDASYDWVISNPPFKLAERFILRALSVAREGVAMLCRTVFLEGMGRYERLFSQSPPLTTMAQFVERVPMVAGRLDLDASSATAYAWFVWDKRKGARPISWVPPCRAALSARLVRKRILTLDGESDSCDSRVC